MTAFKLTELMSIRCAKEIMDGEVVFVGVGLPLVVAGYAMKTHAKNMIMCTEGGAIRATSPPGLAITVDDPCLFTNADATYGMLATMAALQRGEIDVAFIGGAQIDKFGNINSTGVGDWAKKESFTYFAGSGGANDMATSGKRVLGILPQDKKKFVEKVDYITTPGFLGGPGQREKLGMIGNGPSCVVSTMGVYRFDEDTKEMYLAEYFPGQTVEKIKENCAWDLKVSPNVIETPSPTEEELRIIREIDPTGFYLG
ncbi:CoA-transferase subunit beta [Desulfobulbus alkaliphilus]|uniref:CoA-transferase subunit beta n=1 Tax=Desulfobulbus alkaliphilus TaxID=869814 RepID=UPI001965583F|nr:CoA-transferase [Desulfobulbus alkaliphilus]MBM9537503.1 CoA-transferase [Desulfobulbus alkaliphilus]